MLSKKIAYLILAHTDPTQLERLINALNFNCNFFIHIDKYSSIEPFQKLNLPENVSFVQKRERVNWAGFSIVKATINLIKAAIDSGDNYSHLVLLSGLDYPIKPAQAISDYLVSNPNKQFIRFTYMQDSEDYYMGMLTKYFFRDIFPFIPNRQFRRIARYLSEKITKPLNRKYFSEFKPCAGSQWWALSLDCAKYILNFVEQRPDVVSYYKHTFAPDEHFFHTIVANSPYFDQIVYEKNKLTGPHNFANLHIIHPTLVKVYTKDDFDEIQKSNKFFVRKVNTAQSTELLNKINDKILFANLIQ